MSKVLKRNVQGTKAQWARYCSTISKVLKHNEQGSIAQWARYCNTISMVLKHNGQGTAISGVRPYVIDLTEAEVER